MWWGPLHARWKAHARGGEALRVCLKAHCMSVGTPLCAVNGERQAGADPLSVRLRAHSPVEGTTACTVKGTRRVGGVPCMCR